MPNMNNLVSSAHTIPKCKYRHPFLIVCVITGVLAETSTNTYDAAIS